MKITKQDVHHFLDNAFWREAKTYREKAPHEYTLRKHCRNEDLFEAVGKFIRRNGVEEKFYQSTFTYYYYKDKKYWLMSSPYKAKLINRADADRFYGEQNQGQQTL